MSDKMPKQFVSILIIGILLLVGGSVLYALYLSPVKNIPQPTRPTPTFSPQPREQTVTGNLTCLSKRGDQQTAECAYGIETTNGQTYQVSFDDSIDITLLVFDRSYTFTGTVNTNVDEKVYIIDGTMHVNEIK